MTYRHNTVGMWFLGCNTAKFRIEEFWVVLVTQTLCWRAMLNTSDPRLKKLSNSKKSSTPSGIRPHLEAPECRNTDKDDMACVKRIVFDFLLTSLLTFFAWRQLRGPS